MAFVPELVCVLQFVTMAVCLVSFGTALSHDGTACCTLLFDRGFMLGCLVFLNMDDIRRILLSDPPSKFPTTVA